MTDPDVRFERIELPLANPFTISRGTTAVAENVVVEIDDGDRVGIGGAAPSERYGETPASVEAALPDLLAVVENAGDRHTVGCTFVEEFATPGWRISPSSHSRQYHGLAWIERRMRETAPGAAAARAAVSTAVYDLVAKRLDLPLYRYFGLDPDAAPDTSLTVGLDDPDRMAAKARSAIEEGFTILKVKIGSDRPVKCVEAVREVAPDATIRVDANEAWDPETAIGVIDDLAALDVQFVEQPVPASDSAGLSRVGERAALPVAADESCLIATDVPDVAGWADIAVVKLTKTGGIREAVRTIHAAHAHGLDVMLGCMVASNASLAAACHLAPMAEYVDLDGSLLLGEDPFAGVPMPEGRIDLRGVDRPGTGTAQR